MSGLCKDFFTEVDRLLDTNTYERYVRRGQPKINDLLLRMAELAFRHSIGVLVIDEIQNLRKAQGDGANDMLAQIEAIASRAEVITPESLIAASQHRLSFVQPFLSDLRDNVAPEKIEDPDDLAEVDLGKIVQEELDRIYECSSQAADEGEHTQPQEGASAEAGHGQASQANVSLEVLPEQGPRKHTGGAVVLALVQSRLEGKRQHMAPYGALNAGGYIRHAMQYLLTEMWSPSQEECA